MNSPTTHPSHITAWLSTWRQIALDARARPAHLTFGEVRGNDHRVVRGRVVGIELQHQPATTVQIDPADPAFRLPLCPETARVVVKMVHGPGGTMTLTLRPWTVRETGPDEWEVPAWLDLDVETGEPVGEGEEPGKRVVRQNAPPVGIQEEWIVTGGYAW